MVIRARHVYLTALALFLALSLFTSSSIIEPQQADGWTSYRHNEIKLSGGLIFPSWWAKSEIDYHIDGKRVYVDEVKCSAGGIGFSVDIKWCDWYPVWHNGVRWVRYGADFSVKITVWPLSESSSSKWMRESLGPGGDVCCAGHS